MLDANKALVRDMIDEVFNEGRPERLADYWNEKGAVHAADLHRMLTGAFPDLHVRIDDMVAEGDRVVVRLTFTGTHRGLFHGMEPTGRTVEFGAIRIYRLDDGRLVDTWAYQDAVGLMAQLRG